MIPTRLMPLGRGGKRLPDAEVEYLESTGTQWIDTGLVHDGTFRWECDAAITQTSNVNRYLGQTFNTGGLSPRFAFGLNAKGTWYCGIGNTNNPSPSVAGDTSRHIFTVDAPGKVFKVDGAFVYAIDWTAFVLPATTYGGLALFGRKLIDTGSIAPYAAMRIWSSKHYTNGVLVRDFIPVRIGSEGCLYDRRGVGGMDPDGSARNDGIYRNRGTGAFLYGNDI